jgi:hypothetical protein
VFDLFSPFLSSFCFGPSFFCFLFFFFLDHISDWGPRANSSGPSRFSLAALMFRLRINEGAFAVGTSRSASGKLLHSEHRFVESVGLNPWTPLEDRILSSHYHAMEKIVSLS